MFCLRWEFIVGNVGDDAVGNVFFIACCSRAGVGGVLFISCCSSAGAYDVVCLLLLFAVALWRFLFTSLCGIVFLIC